MQINDDLELTNEDICRMSIAQIKELLGHAETITIAKRIINLHGDNGLGELEAYVMNLELKL